MSGNGSVDGCNVIACKDGGKFRGMYQRGCPHKHMLGLGCLPQAEYNMDLEDRKKIHRLLSLNVITQDSQECYGMPYYHSHGSGVQNSAQPKTLENRRSHPVSAGLMHC